MFLKDFWREISTKNGKVFMCFGRFYTTTAFGGPENANF